MAKLRSFDLDESVQSKAKQHGCNVFLVNLTFFATIGGFLFGYNTAIVSGAMLLLGDHFSLSTVWKEGIVSVTIGAAAVSALLAGVLTDVLGRRMVIILTSVMFTAGAALMAYSPNRVVLIIGRLVVGLAIGSTSMSVPVFVAETAPSSVRGALVCINQLLITIGIFVSSLVAGAISSDRVHGWRYMFGLSVIPSIIQFIGFLWLPESPRWLLYKGREEQARDAMKRIRQTDHVDEELNQIKNALEEESVLKENNNFRTFKQMLETQPVRRALLTGCLLLLFQHYYSGSILRLAGFPSRTAIWLVCVPNAANMLFTLPGMALVERTGRRVLTLGSLLVIVVAQIVLGLGFKLSVDHSVSVSVYEGNNDACGEQGTCASCIQLSECGFCFIKDNTSVSGSCLPVYTEHPERYADPSDYNATYRCNMENYLSEKPLYEWADNYCPTEYAWMVILGLGLFVVGFAPGLGPMPWTVNAEIYPLWARSTGMSIATSVCWLSNILVSMTFLSLLETLTTYGTFFLYCGISTAGFITLLVLLPETKDRTLEEVQHLFMSEKYRKAITRVSHKTVHQSAGGKDKTSND